MSHFIRGKQVGVQRDFSAGLDPALFAADIVSMISLFRLTQYRCSWSNWTNMDLRNSQPAFGP